MFPPGIGLDVATLLSTSIECILYGDFRALAVSPRMADNAIILVR